jgi:hypothetical protein
MTSPNNLKYCSDLIYRNLEGIKKNGTFKYDINFEKKEYIDTYCLFNDKISFLLINLLLTKNNKLNNNNQEEINIVKKQTEQYKLSTKWDSIQFGKYSYLFKIQYQKKVKTYIYIYEKLLPPLLKKYNINKKATIHNKYFLNILTYYFYLYKLQFFKTPNRKILIVLFFSNYIKLIKEELYDKYQVNITMNIQNYHQLYLFLKEKKYVSYYYDVIVKEILKNYKEMNKKGIPIKEINLFLENYTSK